MNSTRLMIIVTAMILVAMLTGFIIKTREFNRGRDTAEMASQITVNGKTYIGGSISVQGSKVFIDGVEADGMPDGKGVLKVVITGDVASVKTDAPLVINGHVHGDVNGGTISIEGDVKGNISGGVINCNDVDGNVSGGVVNRR